MNETPATTPPRGHEAGHPPQQFLTWMATQTQVFLDQLASIDHEGLAEASALPGWSRKHLVAHVHHNAEALVRLAQWAGDGIRRPMYADLSQRERDILESAQLPADVLRDLVRDSSTALQSELDGLSAASWTSDVVTAQGRTVPASQIPWLRTREMALHTIDLDSGATFDRLETALVEALIADVVALRSRRSEEPSVRLVARDTGQSWQVHGDTPPVEVTGESHQILAWLTRQHTGGLVAKTGELPVMSSWL